LNITDHPLPAHGARTPWGIMLHTTGDGIPAKAHQAPLEPLQTAFAVYGAMREGPGYVIAPSGAVARLRPDDQVAWHCGVSPVERRDFLSGHWEALAKPGVAGWWKARWPGVLTPSHLYPSTSPNHDYIGVELIPCGTFVKGNSGSWKPVFGEPIGGERGRFTGAQYTAAALLCLTLCRAHSIPMHSPGRVLGHEDVNPLTRPGWDPGDLQGFWSWKTFWGIVNGLEAHL
jgi:N-acetyl-anhydromuramyl-L-alanine amidase AmpD